MAGLPSWEVHGDLFLPGELLEAVVLQESAGHPAARRYEPHQDRAGRRDASEDADRPGADDGLFEDDASYGLMQVMGYNARRIVGASPGTPLNFGFLLRAQAGLAFGLRILVDELEATGGDVPRALARYNGGPTGDVLEPQGTMRRQVYVDGVEAKAFLVRGNRLERGWRYLVGATA